MRIHGLNKTTLLDYPEHVAATIFTGSCNFRCPFCQNGQLVLDPDSQPLLSEDEILSFLKKRKGVLTGVCITGGEPSIQPGLIEFITEIKQLGYLVKLDTNGYRPDILQELLHKALLDYTAMDIKSSLIKYPLVTGCPSIDTNAIAQSAELLMKSGIPYEFRTTVVRELHSRDDFADISHWLAGCDKYFLQSFRESEFILDKEHTYSACTKDTLEDYLSICQKLIPHTYLRGLD